MGYDKKMEHGVSNSFMQDAQTAWLLCGATRKPINIFKPVTTSKVFTCAGGRFCRLPREHSQPRPYRIVVGNYLALPHRARRSVGWPVFTSDFYFGASVRHRKLGVSRPPLTPHSTVTTSTGVLFPSDCMQNVRGQPMCLSPSPWQDGWRELERLYFEGAVRAIGVSNFQEGLLRELLGMATVVPAVVQNWMDPFHQDRAVRALCAKNGEQTLPLSWKASE